MTWQQILERIDERYVIALIKLQAVSQTHDNNSRIYQKYMHLAECLEELYLQMSVLQQAQQKRGMTCN